MLIKRTKERSQEITPDNRGVIWGKELNGMATDEELYGQYLSGDETGLELLIKKYGDPLTLYIDGSLVRSSRLKIIRRLLLWRNAM